MRHWLMKVEADVYSIDDLQRDKVTCWEGVRNYQARNLLRDDFKVGDLVLFYHSNSEPTGVAGLAKIVKAGYPDHFARDKRSDYFDPKATAENPIWFMVDVGFVEKFPSVVSLAQLKAAKGLEKMMVTQRGSRLSVQPVTPAEYAIVCQLAGAKA